MAETQNDRLILFSSSNVQVKNYGVATLLLGLVFFLVWSRLTRRWPFARAEEMADGA